VPGKDGARVTDLKLPFDGQPIQGFSGIKTMADGTFWTLSDNGFGSKANSSDAMLFLHQLKFDWATGKVEVVKNLFLSDPNKKAPFPIVLEGAEKRYLTGADFDIESIQPVADGFWIGEEFGPYILKFDGRRPADRRRRRPWSTASRCCRLTIRHCRFLPTRPPRCRCST
jgi:hypothetical protein